MNAARHFSLRVHCPACAPARVRWRGHLVLKVLLPPSTTQPCASTIPQSCSLMPQIMFLHVEAPEKTTAVRHVWLFLSPQQTRSTPERLPEMCLPPPDWPVAPALYHPRCRPAIPITHHTP